MRFLKGWLGAFIGITVVHFFGALLDGRTEILTTYYAQNALANAIFALMIVVGFKVGESRIVSGRAHVIAGSIVFGAIMLAILAGMWSAGDVTLGVFAHIFGYGIIAGALAGGGYAVMTGVPMSSAK